MEEIFRFGDEFGPAKVTHVYQPELGLKGVLVVDNVARGPAIGGLRMAPDVNTAECFRLARAMTLKNSAAGLARGGGKSVLVGDPRMPRDAKERLIRAFAHALRNERDYIFGPDMGTDESCMAWIKDEIGRAVGLPAAMGGIPLDEIGATGWGLRHAAEVAARYCSIDLRGARVAIQGFGAVGKHAARFLAAQGARVVAASDTQGTVIDAAGLEVDALIRVKDEGRSVIEHGRGEKRDGEAIVEVECDIWIPAARPDVIREDNVHRLKTRLVLEGANIPVTAAAERTLHDRGVIVIPDFIANAGGVICAAMEFAGSSQTAALASIAERISANTEAVLARVKAQGIPPRYGAERRGAPIFSYVRAARSTINERGAITRPDLVVVADDTLLPVPAAGVLQGCTPRTVMLLVSREAAEAWRSRLKFSGLLLVMGESASASAGAQAPPVGALCAGAAARLTGAIGRTSLERAVRAEVASHGTGAVESSLAEALAAFDAMAPHAGAVPEGGTIGAAGYSTPDWIDVPAFPITPQTEIIETLAGWFARGEARGRLTTLESEHSMVTGAAAAAATGVRVFTATSSQGLLYAMEMLFAVPGWRAPFVLVNVSRAVATPITLEPDHTDILVARDTGFVQIHCATCQELLDSVLIAYRLAEDMRVRVPVVVNQDGFYLSFTREPVDMPDAEAVRRFLPPFDPHGSVRSRPRRRMRSTASAIRVSRSGWCARGCCGRTPRLRCGARSPGNGRSR